MRLIAQLLAVAAFAIVPACASASALILDMDGDGLDLSGQTTTDLLGGGMRDVHWTTPNVEDCFLMLDATSVQSAGFTVLADDGSPVNGTVLFRDGISIRPPGSNDVVTTDGWEMLQLFDSNQDSRIDSQDAVWAHLWLFMDYDSDGSRVAGELHRPETALLSIDTGGGDPYLDPIGNTRRDGTWVDEFGASRSMAGVLFATAKPPVAVEATSWGRVKTRFQ